jgi:6-phosphogluconolactonase
VFVYVGSYTEPPVGLGSGITVYRLDTDSGALSLIETVAGIANPSYLALDSEQRYLFAVNEQEEGGVSAFKRDPDSGGLTFINRQRSHGADPCYISLDQSNRYALVANYSSGTVAALPIGSDGMLGAATGFSQHEGSSVNPERQNVPHAHMIAQTPAGRFVLATDLGTDQIMIYTLVGETGELRLHGSANVEPGAGPRHFAFSPSGRLLFVINELSSTLSAFDVDPDSAELRFRQTVSTLPHDFAGETSCAHILLSPDGRFVYGSNRGHDSIVIWAVDQATGDLSLVGFEPSRGGEPRNFGLDPTGEWLLVANRVSNSLVMFRRDPQNGTLTATGQVTDLPTPVAVAFARD